jgi:predicted RNase H-like nuclease (RuvC/YqgF family)
VENNGLREQIEFKTACYIQTEASIASMIKLVKKKEAALEEYDEFLRMNDTSNASIFAAMTKQHAKQIAVLNEQIRNSSEEIKELEHKLGAMERNWSKLKDLCKQKDRQLESAVETAANLERKEKEHANLEAVVKIQSNRIDYLTNLNNEVNQVIHSLTMMLHEKEQAIDDYANFSKKHHEEMQDSSDKIKGLLGIIKRQKFGESEYLRVQLREKNQLQLEVDAMKLRLNSYDMDDQILTDAHIIITVVTVSSGLLLLFWSYIAADITNCL